MVGWYHRNYELNIRAQVRGIKTSHSLPSSQYFVHTPKQTSTSKTNNHLPVYHLHCSLHTRNNNLSYNMKFFSTLTALCTIGTATAASVSVSYDTVYDTASNKLTTVACSDGANRLITRYGYQTFGQIPHFPNIGGSSTIPSWNSNQCGQCYQLTYKGKSINVLAIDTAPSGINIAKAAMNKLTGGQAVQLGRVNASIKKVGVGKCGLTPKRSIEFNA